MIRRLLAGRLRPVIAGAGGLALLSVAGLAGPGLVTADAVDPGIYTTAAGTIEWTFSPGSTPGCEAITGAMQGAFYGTVIAGAVGTYSVTGSACASTASTGTLSLDVEGVEPNGSLLSCPSLAGTYAQTGPILEFAPQGTCAIDRYWSTGTMTFTSVGVVFGSSFAGVTTSLQQKPAA